MKPLEIGFFGGGVNSAVGTTHFIASQMDGRFKVSAGCFSREKSINDETASRWGISPNRCYSSIELLLESERNRLDAIVILTPTPSHVDLVIKALSYGYPVVCEKALATSSEGVEAIIKAQKAYSGYLGVTYNYTGYPMLREMKAMILAGRLGRIQQIQIEMPQEGFSRLSRDKGPVMPQQWRLQDNEVPTISLDLGVHIHHIIGYLTGAAPQEVVATATQKGNFPGIVDNVMCFARYSDEIDCGIWYSKAALGYRNGLKVRAFGSEGSLEWYQLEPENLQYANNTGGKRIIDRADMEVEISQLSRFNRFKAGHPAGFVEAFANVYSDIADEIIEYKKSGFIDDKSLLGPAQALQGLLMLEAMSKSSHQNKWQKVE